MCSQKNKTHSILCVRWWERRHNVLYSSWIEGNLGTRDINIREPNLIIMMYSRAQAPRLEYMFGREYICMLKSACGSYGAPLWNGIANRNHLCGIAFRFFYVSILIAINIVFGKCVYERFCSISSCAYEQ